MMKTIVDRLKMARHVLRGMPLIYGVRFEGEINLPDPQPNVWITRCEFVEVPAMRELTEWRLFGKVLLLRRVKRIL